MKRRILCVLLILTLAIAFPIAAAAESSGPAWESVDWQTYDWKLLEKDEFAQWASLKDWLTKQASLAKLFEVQRNFQHAALSTALFSVIYACFMEEPAKFLIALAKEDENTQENVLFYLAAESEFADKDTTVRTLEGTWLDQEKEPEALQLLADFIGRVEKKLNVTISNPQTGDPVIAVAAALLLSGAGLALITRKKRYF